MTAPDPAFEARADEVTNVIRFRDRLREHDMAESWRDIYNSFESSVVRMLILEMMQLMHGGAFYTVQTDDTKIKREQFDHRRDLLGSLLPLMGNDEGLKILSNALVSEPNHG